MFSYDDITGHIDGSEQCMYDITINIKCPNKDGLPGCGHIIKSYGIYGDMSNLESDINTFKNINLRCPECHYRFNPYEVYMQ